MADEEHLKILDQGVEAWNRWRVDNPEVQPDLSGANLRVANLSGAKTWNTVFAALDLSVVRGLETIKHEGPSTIGIDTIYRSKGKIPEVFLRGCGVHDTIIT